MLKKIQESVIYVKNLLFMQILDLWFKKTGAVKNNPEKLSTTKLGEHISCGYSDSTILAFYCTENKHDV